MVWFPELFQRFDIFEEKNPGVSASVCDVSSIVVSNRFVFLQFSLFIYLINFNSIFFLF